MKTIAHIHTDFPTKFGIPRQAGLVPQLRGEIVFTPPYRDKDALRGIEGYSHIWLIFGFSANRQTPPSPTVRPPRLGGNVRMGVFATRSPYRPNPIGLSCVALVAVREDKEKGPVLEVAGADLLDGTPIYDIKPYLPYTDAHPDARSGFAGEVFGEKKKVVFADTVVLPPDVKEAVCALLKEDPRPAYQAEDGDRVYGMPYADFDIRFTVKDGTVTVFEAVPTK